MKGPLHGSLLATAIAIVLGGCAPVPSPTPAVSSPSPSVNVLPPASASTEVILDQVSSLISFSRPANWARSQPNQHNPIEPGPMIYLSTDPLLISCAVEPDASPHPPDARGMACDWPLAALSPNGVFVDWYTTRIPVPFPSAGQPITLNGEGTRLQISRPGGCGPIFADETMSALVPTHQPARWTNVGVVACLRGPNLAMEEAQVRAMLATAVFN